MGGEGAEGGGVEALGLTGAVCGDDHPELDRDCGALSAAASVESSGLSVESSGLSHNLWAQRRSQSPASVSGLS